MKFITIFLMYFLVFQVLFAQDESVLYQESQELYRNKSNEEAIESFSHFLDQFPDSNKVDDSKWYLGRLYMRIGDVESAKNLFREVFFIVDSNRRTEAFYDLSKILDDEGREESIIELSRQIFPEYANDSYAIRSHSMLFKSYYLVGLRYRGERLGQFVQNLWLEALSVLGLYDDIVLETDERKLIDREKVEFLTRLAAISPDVEQFASYADLAEEALAIYERSYPDDHEIYNKLADDFLALGEGTSDFDYSVKAGFLYNGMVQKPGFTAQLGIGGLEEIDHNLFFSWDLDYNHDSFVFKTFNFNANKTGLDRYLQWKESISGNFGIVSGSKYFFQQSWILGVDTAIAEDPGDFFFGLDFSWDLDWSFLDLSRFSLDNVVSLGLYPDYSNAGREISNINIETNPAYTWVFSPDNSLELGYLLDFKYYFNAHYDTASGGTDPDSRSYLTNGANVALELSSSKSFSIGLEYNFSFLKSFNYDLLVSGNPSNRFVEGFFDYIKNTLQIQLGLSEGIYDGNLSVELGLRNFLNYPARNAQQDFIDELRQDIGLTITLSNSFELMKDQDLGKLGMYADFLLDYQSSNHTYENSYVTNFNNWQIEIGLEWKD